MVPVIWPLVRALVRAGTAKAARIAMIEITTSISINVNADCKRDFISGGVLERRGFGFIEITDYQEPVLLCNTFFFEGHRGQRGQVNVKRIIMALPGVSLCRYSP